MKLLSRDKQWISMPLSTTLTMGTIIFAALSSQANPIPFTIAQSKCSAGDLSRSAPPFRCVTPKTFSCLKRNNAGRGGSVEYRGDTSGEIVVKSDVVGAVALLGFNFDASKETLNLSVKKKNFGVQEQQIWDGFKSTLSKCR